ncbi:hypothetical protein LTR78_006304 [Recurvomyces mirabilis]|uniref:Uncharacterized protein n=1 Tax=Recurvomyces mirabilis TaxID=574656 RepID=A0AAE0WL75_9PEZI|nr:hypothetical protein LTR78_006304 [Recurvomyces mirabilis]KAK5152193.1 hypothetical protein LTS14_008568 [Recurvomyces mirabilis]
MTSASDLAAMQETQVQPADNTAINIDAASNTREPHILAMPPELRLMIYDYIFANQLEAVSKEETAATARKALQPDLLHICQIIRREATAKYSRLLDDTYVVHAQRLEAEIQSFKDEAARSNLLGPRRGRLMWLWWRSMRSQELGEGVRALAKAITKLRALMSLGDVSHHSRRTRMHSKVASRASRPSRVVYEPRVLEAKSASTSRRYRER